MSETEKQHGSALPRELEPIRKAASLAIDPIREVGPQTKARKDTLFTASRTRAGERLPEYYLVYFLLVDLLGFQNLGKFEKISWSVPLDFRGKAFLIEHRKFGVGVFAQDPDIDEPDAEEIVRLIKRGVEAARPFFEWLAQQAITKSELNVENQSRSLFERFRFFVRQFDSVSAEAEHRKNERRVESGVTASSNWQSISFPAAHLSTEAQWLRLAAIEAFFGWTEHVFIHLAILKGTVTSGTEIAHLATAPWKVKFERALDTSVTETKVFLEKLLSIRRQLRNFMAHGAFGKQGEAFHFHSGAGAVPVLLTSNAGSYGVSLAGEVPFDEKTALEVLENFIEYLWDQDRAPARLYIQESDLPLILTMAKDGTYVRAMRSLEEMEDLLEGLTHRWEQSVNMDW